MMGALQDLAAQDARAGALRRASRTRSRRRIDDRGSDFLIERGLHRRLRDHRRADRPAHRRPGEGRARDAPRGERHRGARLDAVAGRQRDPEGASTRSARSRSLPFARETSDLFDRPSINLGRILGGDALNKVPDLCVIDVDIRYLPGPGPEDDPRGRSRSCPDVDVVTQFHRAAGDRRPRQPVRAGARRARSACGVPDAEPISVGRDGASDAICFLDAGVPAVEFGPVGDGHHGPEEWVSVRVARRATGARSSTSCDLIGPRDRLSDEPPDACQDIPRPGLWKRLLRGAVLVIVVAAARRHGRRPRSSRSTTSSTRSSRRRAEARQEHARDRRDAASRRRS